MAVGGTVLERKSDHVFPRPNLSVALHCPLEKVQMPCLAFKALHDSTVRPRLLWIITSGDPGSDPA